MRYHSYSQTDAEVIRAGIISNEEVDISQLGREVGEGELVNLSTIHEICSAAVGRCLKGEDPEAVELSVSGSVYLALRHVPVVIRDDPGFWRWVTISAMLPFLRARDTSDDQMLGIEAIGAGSNRSDILACRMFLRAQTSRKEKSNGDLQFDLLTDLGTKNHDFWQSHIVRVSTGSERQLARALIRSHASDHIPTGKLRDFIRDRVNRPKTTLATFLMSDDEADEFIESQRNRFLDEGNSE